MVEVVDAGLAVVEVGWWDPFGVAVGVFSGGPALFGEAVVGSAGQGQGVDVGATGARPAVDVVDLGPVAGDVATRLGAATVLGMNVEVMHPNQDGRSASWPAPA